MDIHKMVQESLQKWLDEEGQRLFQEAYNPMPYVVYTVVEDNPHTIDSTAIVIDSEVKALPAPQTKKEGAK